MKVKAFMTKKVITIPPDARLEKVFSIFNTEPFRHLPVIEDKRLKGIISERDLKKILPQKSRQICRADGTCYSRLEDSLPHNALLLMRAERDGFKVGPVLVSDIMKTSVVTIAPDTDIVDAAAIMADKKIGALPVIRDHKLVGILTETDVLRAFVDMTRHTLKPN